MGEDNKGKKGFFARAAETAGVMPRLSVPITRDRKRFATESLQGKTAKQLREILIASLADPEFVAAMELPQGAGPVLVPAPAAAPPPPPAEDAIPSEACDLILEGIQNAMIFVARRKGYTEQQAGVLAIDGTRRRAYIPRMVKIANKWLPAGALGKYEDEILLVMAFAADTLASVKLMQERAKTERPDAHAFGVVK
jgi:hypothetical protein